MGKPSPAETIRTALRAAGIPDPRDPKIKLGPVSKSGGQDIDSTGKNNK